MDTALLMKKAEEALKFSYAPYSKIKVGAALLTKAGKVFSACNVENSSHGLTICAERVAAAKAVSEGHKDFIAIAVASNKIENIVPCGACLQFLCEFSPAMKIIIRNKSGAPASHPLKKLLPMGFHIR